MFKIQMKPPKSNPVKTAPEPQKPNAPIELIAGAAVAGAVVGSLTTLFLGPYAKKAAQSTAEKVHLKLHPNKMTPQSLNDMIALDTSFIEEPSADDFGYSANIESEKETNYE